MLTGSGAAAPGARKSSVEERWRSPSGIRLRGSPSGIRLQAFTFSFFSSLRNGLFRKPACFTKMDWPG